MAERPFPLPEIPAEVPLIFPEIPPEQPLLLEVVVLEEHEIELADLEPEHDLLKSIDRSAHD
jgi:hypothetical protein